MQADHSLSNVMIASECGGSWADQALDAPAPVGVRANARGATVFGAAIVLRAVGEGAERSVAAAWEDLKPLTVMWTVLGSH